MTIHVYMIHAVALNIHYRIRIIVCFKSSLHENSISLQQMRPKQWQLNENKREKKTIIWHHLYTIIIVNVP